MVVVAVVAVAVVVQVFNSLPALLGIGGLGAFTNTTTAQYLEQVHIRPSTLTTCTNVPLPIKAGVR